MRSPLIVRWFSWTSERFVVHIVRIFWPMQLYFWFFRGIRLQHLLIFSHLLSSLTTTAFSRVRGVTGISCYWHISIAFFFATDRRGNFFARDVQRRCRTRKSIICVAGQFRARQVLPIMSPPLLTSIRNYPYCRPTPFGIPPIDLSGNSCSHRALSIGFKIANLHALLEADGVHLLTTTLSIIQSDLYNITSGRQVSIFANPFTLFIMFRCL